MNSEPAMSVEQAEALRDGLIKQRSIYSVLERLTVEQRDVLVRGDTAEIARLAGAKDQELARIDEIDQTIEPLKRTWTGVRDQLDPELRGAIEREIEQLGKALESLLMLEQSAADGYQAMLDDQKAELRQAEGRRRVARAYGNATSAPGSTPPVSPSATPPSSGMNTPTEPSTDSQQDHGQTREPSERPSMDETR